MIDNFPSIVPILDNECVLTDCIIERHVYNFFHLHSALALFTRVSWRPVQAITFPFNPETSATFTNVCTQLARNSQKRSRQQSAFMNKSSRKTAVSHRQLSVSRGDSRESKEMLLNEIWCMMNEIFK